MLSKDKYYKQRIGRFRVSHDLINNNPTAVKNLLSKVLIVRAESLFYADAIEYVAFSKIFGAVPIGVKYYDYILTINMNKEKSKALNSKGWDNAN